MNYHLELMVKKLLGIDIAGRNFAIFPDDTFLVSYPRSGNTWTRFLIANLVNPGVDVSFKNIERLIPDTSSQSSRALRRAPRPRIIKTHEYFDHRCRKIVCIVRDPRDVALSYYDFQRKYRHIEDGYPLVKYVDDFVSGRLNSKDWGTWGENVASWLYTRGKSNDFLLLRYEDMIEDPVRELARTATFLGIASDPARIEQAVQRSSADRMREMEKSQSADWVATKNHRTDIPFVRLAKSGGWKEKLPEECVVQIEAAWGETMLALGYELVSATMHPMIGVLSEKASSTVAAT
jgi:Sulfotransferase domain